jgi:biopolymer transport protein ExbD
MKFRRRLQPSANSSFVPMVDVVFQLVIFFMVSSTFIVTPGIKLNLPSSSSAEPVPVTPLVVSVFSDKRIYLNRTEYDLAGFRSAVAALPQAEQKNKSIVVEGDRTVSYDLMVKILDVLRVNGFQGVNLKTMPEGRSAPPAGGGSG